MIYLFTQKEWFYFHRILRILIWYGEDRMFSSVRSVFFQFYFFFSAFVVVIVRIRHLLWRHRNCVEIWNDSKSSRASEPLAKLKDFFFYSASFTEAKLLAIHPTHAQTTPQHQIHAQQQQPQQCQQQQQLSSTNKPGNFHNCISEFLEKSKVKKYGWI